jgi:hypothetical protein
MHMSRWAKRLVPSPAMIVALVALFVALSGSAYALVITGKQIRNNSVTSKDIRNRGLNGTDIRRDSVGGGSIKESTLGLVNASVLTLGSARYTVVNAAGQQVRGRDTTSVARTSQGRYQAIFSGDVRNCAYFATVGDPTASGPPQNGQISVGSLSTNVNGVAIRTENGNGNQADKPFHLIVLC